MLCLLAQQLQLPKSTCVRRDLGTSSRTGQWALIIQPSGPQIIADMTCAVKAATQIRVINSAHFILSYRALNSLCSFTYNKQTRVCVHTHYCLYTLYLPAHPLTPWLASLNLLLWKSIIHLPHASPLWGYYFHSYLILALLSRLLPSVTFTMFQEDDFSLYLFVKWVPWLCVGGETWQFKNGKQLYIIHPVAFIFIFYINDCCEMRSQAFEQRNI